MKTVSRREFLKGAALSAAGLAAAGLLAGCSSENKDASQQPSPTEAPAASDWLGKAIRWEPSIPNNRLPITIIRIGWK